MTINSQTYQQRLTASFDWLNETQIKGNTAEDAGLEKGNSKLAVGHEDGAPTRSSEDIPCGE